MAASPREKMRRDQKQMTEDIENRTDMNTGKNGSEMGLLDLGNCVRLNLPIEEIAGFMCRSRREIRDKIAELERSGELQRLVEQAANEAVDEPDETDEIAFGEKHAP